jgi:hypothetical protein
MGPQGPQGLIEVDWSEIANLCAIMPRRLLVTGILVQWLRNHFTDANNIETPILRHDLWTPDIATTGITIDSVYKWQPSHTEARPGIFIKPGPWKVLRYGIDDRKMGGTRNCAGCSQHNAMYQGSHTLFCIAGESAEVELLGAEVYRELMEFGPAARKVFGFLRFQVTDIGEPSILEEANQNFVVPIVVSYGAQDVWNLNPQRLQTNLRKLDPKLLRPEQQ